MVTLQQYAAWHYRYRWWISGVVLLVCAILIPNARVFRLENDLATWFTQDDPNWTVYREYREEFGGSRNLIIGLESTDLFTVSALQYIVDLTDRLERIPHVLRVYSLATANQVLGGEDRLEVQSYLEDVATRDPVDLRRLILNDRRLVGDLISSDGTLTVITMSFHEADADPIRDQLLNLARDAARQQLPPGTKLHFNGGMEISQEYDRQSLQNLHWYPLPMLLLVIIAVYYLFRSWFRVVLVAFTTLLAIGATLAIFALLGFKYNILSTMIIPLVTVLAIADDMHLLQSFDEAVARGLDRPSAFRFAIEDQFAPMFGAGLTTALGIASLGVSEVAAVREFGIATAIGILADFAISFALVPAGLTLAPPRKSGAPAGERLGRALEVVAKSMAPHSRTVLAAAALLVAVSVVGMFRLKASTNHIRFFPEGHPIQTSARLIDQKLAGVYNFEVILEGPRDAFKDPAVLHRADGFVHQIEKMPHVGRALSFLDGLKEVHRALSGCDASESCLPDTEAAVAQSVFVYGLNDAGRRDLQSFVTSDFSRMRIWVKMKARASEEVFQQILEVEQLASKVFTESSAPGIQTVVTGSGRLYASLDAYLVQSQLRSFGTAFLTVFGVIFVLFRSWRYGFLSILPNLIPIALVLGLMGWIGISLNVATVMVASIALGVIDDDTVHFITRFRRDTRAGADVERALSDAIRHAGGAALLAALINCLAFGITGTCPFKPIAYWGCLMSLTMVLAFLSEVLILPALIRVCRRFLV